MILGKNKLQLILLFIKIMLRVFYSFATEDSGYSKNTESIKSSSFLLTMLEAEKRRQGHQQHHAFSQNGDRGGERTKRASSTDTADSQSVSSPSSSPQQSDNEQDKMINFVAYFSGHEIIRYSDIALNFDRFTIEFWIFIEGGQMEDLVFLHIYDHCSFADFSSITIGLKEMKDGQDLRIYFKLRTIGAEKYTTLFSHEKISILKWTHVAAVYDGDNMIMYVNQAKVAVSLQQNGLFLSNIYHKCTTLDIAGDIDTFSTFRGSLDKIRIYNFSLTHRNIANAMNQPGYSVSDNNTVLFEDFNPGKNTSLYYSVNGYLPELVPSKIVTNNKENAIQLVIPQCGKTICDNPALIQNYAKYPHIYMNRKIINYNIVLLADDDGKLLITMNELKQKDKEINSILNRYNIFLKLHTVVVKDSDLFNKTVLLNCYGHCPTGTDCLKQSISECKRVCTKDKIANKICNPECNNPAYLWDSGDCCNGNFTNTTETCYDHQSIYRAFISEKELRIRLNITSRNYLTIFPLKFPSTSAYLAKATFPWVDGRFGVRGGIVISIESFRKSTNDLIHELGHMFGLWHVHRGVSEITTCKDACAELSPSMTTGDLCSDTNPTSKNYNCISQVNHTDHCGGFKVYEKTPFRNYMGYATGNCANEFTKQQQARMHCYIDKTYQRWQPSNRKPSPVPLPPQVSSSSSKGNQVEITWAPPVGHGKLHDLHQCDSCNVQRKVKQYASSAIYTDGATFAHPAKQIVSAPNAVTCPYFRDAFNAWYPTRIGQSKDAYLEVVFKESVVPTALKIWVIQHGKKAIKDLVLVHGDNTTRSLGSGTAHCDAPYTRRIKTRRSVQKIQVHLTKRQDTKYFPGIDAVELISEQPSQKNKQQQFQQHCGQCQKLQLRYHVTRNPPFRNNVLYKKVKTTSYRDDDIVAGKNYSYTVQAVSDDITSIPSPPLVYRSTDGFCGNGIIEKRNGEECDDGNSRDGDGCNVECRMEAIFDCRLQPSLCYRYDRDGICEGTERDKGTRDCNYLTPKGFTDQWSTNVIGKKHQSDGTCPESVIAGKPPDDLKCTLYSPDSIDLSQAWYPCYGLLDNGDFLSHGWIEAGFPKNSLVAAIIIYFKSDGRFSTDSPHKTINVKLKDIHGNYHTTSKSPIAINCKTNPTLVHMTYDEKTTKFLTAAVRIEFEIGYLAIAGIALRSQDNPCGPSEFFNEKTSKCEAERIDLSACSTFKMPNSNVTCNNNGRHCNVTCNYGYQPKSTFPVYCKNGIWSKSKKCIPVDCGKLTVQNAKTSCEKHTLGSVCSFSCVHGSYLHGNITKMTCHPSGRWSRQKSHCYKVCSQKPNIDNAIPLNGSCVVKELSSTNVYHMGTRCRFKCLQGYKAVRKVNLAGAMDGHLVNAHCSGFGEWIKDATCQPIKCPKLSRMNELMYNCTKSNFYNSTCTTSCLRMKVPYSVKCQDDGKWSSILDVCTSSNVTCGLFPNIDGIDVSSCKSTSYGSACQPKCRKYGMDIVQKFEDGRKFMNKDVIFYCMPNSKWLPSPSNNLYCEKKCFGYYMRSKNCDCVNNREHCNYDNGACCGKNVRYSMFYRGPKCGCIDPKFKTV